MAVQINRFPSDGRRSWGRKFDRPPSRHLPTTKREALTAEEWPQNEAGLLRRFEEASSEFLIDAVYIFKRGLINLSSDTGIFGNRGGDAIM